MLAARTELGLSRVALADGAGVSDRAIAGWERDGKVPNPTQLGRVVAYLRAEFGLDLYTYNPAGDTDASIRSRVRHALSPSDAAKVIAALDRLDDETNPG